MNRGKTPLPLKADQLTSTLHVHPSPVTASGLSLAPVQPGPQLVRWMGFGKRARWILIAPRPSCTYLPNLKTITTTAYAV